MIISDMLTIPQSEHQIDIADIDPDCLYVLEKLQAKGYEAYLVGGGVRDLLMGRKPKDFDISTSAKPEEVKQLFRRCLLIGRRFRLAHIRFGSNKIIEVSTFRAGDNESEELIVHDNVWGNAEEDVLRRDFTINGLCYDSSNQTILDYVGGFEDAKKRILRTIGQPYVRFKQDPVRMIRMLKFMARFGLEADPEAEQALLECRHDVTLSSPARVLEELLRMLESGASAKFFKLLSDRGIMQVLSPELSDFLESPNGDDIYTYLKEVDENIEEPHQPQFHRVSLLSCLIFPMLDIQLKAVEQTPHLGEVHRITNELINGVFHPFFVLPRRLRSSLAHCVSNQYRITPFIKRKKGRIRIPRLPDFPHAIEFLKVRSCVEPGLADTLLEWKEALEKQADLLPKRPRRPRRRRRRRGP